MQRSAILWGGLLILLGVLFLLSSMGVISFNVWTLFWPIALIVGGLWLLTSAFSRKETKAQHVAMELKGAETAEVHVKYGAGRVTLDGGAPPDELLNGTFSGGVEYDARDKGNGRIRLELRSPADGSWGWGGWENRQWDISLNRDIPLALHLETGAAETIADLRDMNVNELELHTGASKTEITLPATAGFTRVNVEGGATSIVLNVPEGVAASIRGNAGMGSIDVDAGRFPRQGNRNESVDFDSAVNRVEITASVGAGSVAIR